MRGQMENRMSNSHLYFLYIRTHIHTHVGEINLIRILFRHFRQSVIVRKKMTMQEILMQLTWNRNIFMKRQNKILRFHFE